MSIMKALEKAPWWAQLTAWVGLPGALLTFIVYVVFSGMNTAVAETRAAVIPHVEQTTKLMRKLDDYLWIMCRSTAKSDGQLHECDRVRREN